MIGPLVDTAWLASQLDEPDIVVLDCTVLMRPDVNGSTRVVSGREEFSAGHIPGAGFADLINDLSDPSSHLSFAVPTPEAFCAAVGALGVGDTARVVLYDTTISSWAARVWWMLRWVGFDNAAVLDGGLRAWTTEGRALSTATYAPSPAVLTPRVRHGLVAGRDDVRAAIGDGNVVLVDTLPAGHFSGEAPMYARPGHIPGAVNVPAFELLDESGRFLPLDELGSLHPFDREQRTITYCGGGIAASTSALALTRLGFTNVAVYAASLQEWAADPDNPLTVDDESL